MEDIFVIFAYSFVLLFMLGLKVMSDFEKFKKKRGYKLINKVNFAHNSVLEELTKVPLNSKYGLWLNHFKTCEYSLSRELIYFMKVIYLKNYENSISKELK